MTKELEKQLSNFHLSEEEINIIKVEKDDVDDTTVEVVEELGAIGFLQGSKSPGIKFLKSALSTAWKPKQEFDIQQIKECLFAFQFFNDEDRRKALCGGPWNFDNRLMVLKPIERDKDVEEIDFSMTEMWIRIRKIPLKLRTSKIAKKIGAMFGSLKLFDKENSGVWSNYMRIRVEVNVKKPLRRGVLLEVDNENVWFKIAYERLPIFCYNCGLLGHIQKECEMERVPEDEQQYGGWLRALSPLKRIGAKNSTEATKIAALWSSVKQRKSSGENSGETYDGNLQLVKENQKTTSPRFPDETPRRRLFDFIKVAPSLSSGKSDSIDEIGFGKEKSILTAETEKGSCIAEDERTQGTSCKEVAGNEFKANQNKVFTSNLNQEG
ncbi:hypothetical protein LINGRAHAP2_LOCUS322 [Linum grandiflorum]